MTAHVHDAHTTPQKLGTYYAHPQADALYLDMMDAINEIVAEAGYGLKTEARALRDMLSRDLPRVIRQVEKATSDVVLAEIHRIALDVQQERAAGVEHGMQTAVKYEARRRNQIRVGKLPRRLRTRRT